MAVRPYYEDGQVTIYHGDAEAIVPTLDLSEVTCVVVDPPFDVPTLYEWAGGIGKFESELVLCDPRTIGYVCAVYGIPAWVFTWDTMATWTTGPSRPLTQTKFCAWFGELSEYQRDAVFVGPPPEGKAHPSTQFTPAEGRRLSDLYRESLRWLHHPGAGEGSAGSSRFGKRQGDPSARFAKPVGWLRGLIGNTSHGGGVLDPFCGSGAALRAAKDLGRRAIGVDIDERCCEAAALRCSQLVLNLGGVI